jgi:hypothetical protein
MALTTNLHEVQTKIIFYIGCDYFSPHIYLSYFLSIPCICEEHGLILDGGISNNMSPLKVDGKKRTLSIGM